MSKTGRSGGTLKRIAAAVRAGQAGIVLPSLEPEEILQELRDYAATGEDLEQPWELLFWSAAEGATDSFGNLLAPAEEETDPAMQLGGPPQKLGLHSTLEMILQGASARRYREEAGASQEGDETVRILIVQGFDRMLSPHGEQGPVDALLLSLAQKLIHEGQGCQVFLVMQTAPDFEAPPELAEHCEFIPHELPTSDERADILRSLGLEEEAIDDKVLDATAGLSRAKTTQYVAESLSTFGRVNVPEIFRRKAEHLSRSSRLSVWSPTLSEQVQLRPSPELEKLHEARDVRILDEENEFSNSQLSSGEVRVKIAYSTGSHRVEEWLDPMPKEEFERLYRPQRDFFSFKSIIGLDGLKNFLRVGTQPGVPLRSRLRHVLMLGVPGTGKSHTMRCAAGELGLPLSEMRAADLMSKWLGDTDKRLARMLRAAEMIGGILAIDEFQRFIPSSGGSGESGGVENRMGGTLLTWFNDQTSNLVLSAANNISNLPDEFTRSGRVDALVFVGFPGEKAKQAAWDMYLSQYELEKQELPADQFWTPADIMNCCRLAEQQKTTIVQAAKWITPSYEKNREQMDSLMEWAEHAGCLCAETGERFSRRAAAAAGTTTKKKARTRLSRKIGKARKEE